MDVAAVDAAAVDVAAVEVSAAYAVDVAAAEVAAVVSSGIGGTHSDGGMPANRINSNSHYFSATAYFCIISSI